MLLDVGQTQPLSPGKSSGYSGIKDKILGKDDFLKMLVAQLHYQDPMNPMESTDIIGKSVKANGNAVYFNGSDPVQIPFHLGSDAQNVKIEIYDSNGNVVRTLTADDLQQGDQYLEWDGTDTNGYQLSKGKYTVKISATDSEGNPVDANTYMMGEVTGIKYTANGAVLLVGELEINFSDVIEILGQTV